jgi:putative lipoic acid-binding regulatory protein
VEGNGSPFEFPCDIPVKVFGRNEDAFRDAVLAIARRHFPDLDDADVTARPSRQDRYLSMTLTVWADSRERIDAFYGELSRHAAVLMVL